MSLIKQSININFAQGLDTKTDPWQVPVGRFLSLQNSIFTKAGLLQKRNGFGVLSTISDSSVTQLSTFNGDLTAIGNSLYAYNAAAANFVNKGRFQQASLSVLPAVRNNLNQTQCDSAVSPNALACIVYSELNNSTTTYKYVVIDSTTGQNLVAPALLIPTSGTVSGSPRVFVLGTNFIIVYTVTISGAYHLQYQTISYNSLAVGSAVNIISTYTAASSVAFDGVICNGNLYLAWNASSSAGIEVTYITPSLSIATPVFKDATHQATIVSVCTDGTTIYVSYFNSGSSTGYIFGITQFLNTQFAATQWIASGTIKSLTLAALQGVCTIFYETQNTYSYDSNITTNFVSTRTCTSAGALGSASVLKRSVGLASKAFYIGTVLYVTITYDSKSISPAQEASIQPTYFVIDSTGYIVTAFAYQNGGGYLTTGLPSVTVTNNLAQFVYLYKDLVQAANTGTNLSTGVPTAQVYSQTGINLISLSIGGGSVYTAETGKNLNLSGGFLWSFDGYQVAENNFFVYPENVKATWSATGGSMVAQPLSGVNTNAYYYRVTYEWTDNQGNAFRSSPSLPLALTTTGNGTSGSVTLNIPTLRLTNKSTDVKIVIYRWSVAQQNYFQITSLTAPILNNTTIDSVSFVDTLADSSILGNNLIYTTGGVIENVFGPSSVAITLFDDRLWLVDAEDQNLLWYSKQVIEATPVEMSDLFTFYISPTQAAQGSTGPITAIAPMDDKLVIFKKDAIYYINGVGPDNTGANSQYSQPVFVTSTVGCALPNSIVLMPNGLMFQSDKGIWLLGRDLSTSYIGAPVESLTLGYTCETAIVVPETNQVRFTMNSGVTLMYDYYFQQWGTFNGIPGLSSVVYGGLHTFLNSYNQIQQETPQVYLDGTNPVLMSFKTGWIALAGLQGFQRAYFLYLIGQYLTPHRLIVGLSYDYNPVVTQQNIIVPDNYSAPFGGDSVYGASPAFGGVSQLEQWRIMLQNQKCESIQLTLNEIYDPTIGVAPGAGFTLSGINIVIGTKKGYYTSSKYRTVG